MAPGWRTRFNKGDRFQKLDDNDHHDDEDEDVYARREITPMSSSGVMLSSEPTTVSSSYLNSLEKKALLQTPNNRNTGKPLKAVSSPETTATVMTTPRASPVSISSRSSSQGSHPDSSVAMFGAGQRKSTI